MKKLLIFLLLFMFCLTACEIEVEADKCEFLFNDVQVDGWESGTQSPEDLETIRVKLQELNGGSGFERFSKITLTIDQEKVNGYEWVNGILKVQSDVSVSGILRVSIISPDGTKTTIASETEYEIIVPEESETSDSAESDSTETSVETVTGPQEIRFDCHFLTGQKATAGKVVLEFLPPEGMVAPGDEGATDADLSAWKTWTQTKYDIVDLLWVGVQNTMV